MPYNDIFFSDNFPAILWPNGQWPSVFIPDTTGMPSYNFCFEKVKLISDKFKKINLKNNFEHESCFYNNVDSLSDLLQEISNLTTFHNIQNATLDIIPIVFHNNTKFIISSDTHQDLDFSFSTPISINNFSVSVLDLRENISNNAHYINNFNYSSDLEIYYFTFVSGGLVGGNGTISDPFITSEVIPAAFYHALVLAVYESLGVDNPIFVEI